jgi:thioredoxin-dependent peroxiredoxin
MSFILDKNALEIEVVNNYGQTTTISNNLDNILIIYFYPKDDTPGCTKEACGFRDLYSELAKLGAKVVGVSKDNNKSHIKFIDKYSLNFELWSDEEHKLCEAFGVWQKKKFMGKEYMGIDRSTFVLNKNGEVIKVWEDVKPEEHAQEVLDFIRNINKS